MKDKRKCKKKCYKRNIYYMSYSSGKKSDHVTHRSSFTHAHKCTQTHTDSWNVHTLLLCHWSRGRGPNRQKGSGRHMSTRAAFYMRLMALWNIPLAVSDLSISLLFMPAVKVWVPCHNSPSVIFLSQNLWGKKKRTKGEKRGFLQLFTHNKGGIYGVYSW